MAPSRNRSTRRCGASPRCCATASAASRRRTIGTSPLATPGADIARVEVLPRFRPFQRRFGVNGSVSVMVLPGADVPKPPNPRPGRILVEQVRNELEARRPLATELFVIGPEYRGLGVSAAFDVREGFARDRVARAVREALALYLWPLAPGGRDGDRLAARPIGLEPRAGGRGRADAGRPANRRRAAVRAGPGRASGCSRASPAAARRSSASIPGSCPNCSWSSWR